jgi:hypothetical protein
MNTERKHMNEYDEINAKCDDFAIRRAKILVKIKEQKLKLARLDLHYTQFISEITAADRDQPNEGPN